MGRHIWKYLSMKLLEKSDVAAIEETSVQFVAEQLRNGRCWEENHHMHNQDKDQGGARHPLNDKTSQISFLLHVMNKDSFSSQSV